MAMASAVSSSVTSRPRRILPENRNCPTTSHWNRCSRLPFRSTVENASEWTIMTPSTSSTAPLTHRPVWRRGTAFSVSGWSVRDGAVLSAGEPVGGVAIVTATPASRRPDT